MRKKARGKRYGGSIGTTSGTIETPDKYRPMEDTNGEKESTENQDLIANAPLTVSRGNSGKTALRARNVAARRSN